MSRSRTGDMAPFGVPDGTDDDNIALFIDPDDWAPTYVGVDPARNDTVELSTGNLQNGMIELFSTGELTDFTIICGADVYQVHAVVLVGQSTFFRGAVFGANAEGIAKNVRLTPMDDEHPYTEFDDPQAEAHFLYYQTYELGSTHDHTAWINPLDGPRCRLVSRQSVDMLEHAKMFAIAVKYGVASLRGYAHGEFKRAVRLHFDGPELGNAIREVSTSTPEDAQELRDITRKELLHHRELLRKTCIRAAIESVEGLAYDLLVAGKGQ
ncbi:unnamed protein product [Zymoseptoria tritici ST99CH_3D1]|nr:unnamed protein product [Zymoseptoria tritici ST99CH_3D1]